MPIPNDRNATTKNRVRKSISNRGFPKPRIKSTTDVKYRIMKDITRALTEKGRVGRPSILSIVPRFSKLLFGAFCASSEAVLVPSVVSSTKIPHKKLSELKNKHC